MTKEKIRNIAAGFIRRAEYHDMKGKARDRAAVEFFLGAVTGLKALAGDDEHSEAGKLCEHLLRVTTMMVGVRGYKAVVELANEEGVPPVAPEDMEAKGYREPPEVMDEAQEEAVKEGD